MKQLHLLDLLYLPVLLYLNILGYQVGEFIPKSTLKKRYISHINQKVRERAGTDNK